MAIFPIEIAIVCAEHESGSEMVNSSPFDSEAYLTFAALRRAKLVFEP